MKHPGIVTLALIGALVATGAMAQGPAGGAPAGAGGAAAPGGPAGGGRGAARPPSIDLPTAQKMMAGAQAAAVAANVNVGIAIVDANGDLVNFVRMNGASTQAVTSSQGKARAALLFGMPSKAVADALAAGTPVSVTLTSPQAGADLTLQQGAVPVYKDGKIVAAIGVGGAAPALDERIAQAGADAVK